MSKLLRALERVGLVETDRAHAPEADTVVVETPPEEPLAVADAEPAAPIGELVEQRPFDQFYADQSVPPVPFNAEKLLRVLDGLAALDPISRKAAVQALDAADDGWSIDDVLLDAERKARALAVAKRDLEQHARAALQSAREAIEARDLRQQDAVTRIRQQITDLEALLEREVTRATEEKTQFDAQARATKDACQREITRIDLETARLARIAAIFGAQSGAEPAR